jgi:hypothetical protein
MMVNRFREVTMGAVIALREDYDAADLRRIAKGSKDAARIGATDLQVIRDWVLRFNALGPSGLLDRKAPGNPPKLDTAQRKALAAIVESEPGPGRRRINAQSRPIYSAPSAPREVSAPASFCPVAILRPCNGISKKYHHK